MRIRNRRVALAVVGGLVAVASSCVLPSAGDDETLPAELGVVASTALECPGSATEPPDNFERVFDAVALPTSPLYPSALQTSRREAADGSVYYFAKTGLMWRANVAFEIAVPTELHPTLALGWGLPGAPAHLVTVDCEADDAGSDDAWVGMPGGYWVTEPMCVEVIVRTATDERRVEIGLGMPCAGQGPPIGPSAG